MNQLSVPVYFANSRGITKNWVELKKKECKGESLNSGIFSTYQTKIDFKTCYWNHHMKLVWGLAIV